MVGGGGGGGGGGPGLGRGPNYHIQPDWKGGGALLPHPTRLSGPCIAARTGWVHQSKLLENLSETTGLIITKVHVEFT